MNDDQGINGPPGPPLPTTSSIQKLNGDNFLPWKRQISIILKLRGLERALTETKVPEKVELQATLILLESMDESHRLIVQAEPTAFAIMSNLERQYANRSLANKHRLLSTFMKIQKSPNESLNQHVGRMKEMRAALANLEENYTEAFFQVVIINSLGSEYGDILEQWELIHSDMKTTEFLLNLLQQKEASVDKDKMALAVSTKRDWKDLSIEEKKKITKCGVCKKKGHWARECPNNAYNDKEKANASANITFSLGNLGTSIKDKWVLDSGATQHMCNNRDWFLNLKMFTTPMKASVGNGDPIDVLGQGTIRIRSTAKGLNMEGSLTEVSFIPSLATNLISVSAASKNGIKTKFTNAGCQMEKGDKLVATGDLCEQALYILNLEAVTEQTALVVKSTRTWDEWHSALGHPGAKRLEKLLADKSLGISATGVLNPCSVCPMGKATHAQHKSSSAPKASSVGEKVHIDLGTLINKDRIYVYYMLCKDEASGYCLVYFVDSKDKVHEALLHLIVDFEHGSGQPIRTLISDNGSEFKNKRNEYLFLKEKIVHETSAPYIAEQNGSIEREMRTIAEMVRVMLTESGLDRELAKEAIQTACYLKNRTPRLEESRTPFELFTGRKPYLAHLVPFGTQVHILDNCHKLPKLEPKTVTGLVVGFTNRRNTYRVYVPSWKRTTESCDIYFNPHPSKLDDGIERTTRTLDDARFMIYNEPGVDIDDDGSESVHSWTPPQPYNRSEFFHTAMAGDPLTSTVRKGHRACVDHDYSRPIAVARGTVERTHRSEDGSSPPPLPPRDNRESAVLLISGDVTEPRTYNEAVQGPNSEKWQEAINSELMAHEINQTWVVVDRPDSGTRLSAKWIFTLKRNKSGLIERFKARLVARGFEQRAGIDYTEIFAPVARNDTIRVVLAIASSRQMNIVQFDVSTAFLHGTVTEILHVEAPPGVQVGSEQCLQLVKALYGLKQAPRAWNQKLDATLNGLGLKATISDPCLYVNKQATLLLVIYVDDGLIIGQSKDECYSLLSKLEKEFQIKELSGELFVGIEISQTNLGIEISQRRYINDILNKFNMETCKGTNCPINDVVKIFADGDDTMTNAPYREAVGSLLYLANSTRPDILFAVNLLARFNQEPKVKHWLAVKQVFKYLKQTKDYSIRYGIDPDIKIDGFCDADWGSAINERYSTSGTLILVGGGPVIYGSRKQSTIALSSTEAEYLAACEIAKDLFWLNQLLKEINVSHEVPQLWVDNQSAIQQIKNYDTRRRSKHVDIKYHYIRKQYQDKLFSLEYLESQNQPADILTKPISGAKMLDTLQKSGMMNISSNKNKGSSKGALIILCILALNHVAKGYRFTRVEPTIWTTTDYSVQTGVKQVLINYSPVSPCDLRRDDKNRPQDIRETNYQGLEHECVTIYDRDVRPLIDKLANCRRDIDHGPHQLIRQKRFIEPITMVVGIGTLVCYVVGCAATAIYSYYSSDSSYNRLNAMEKREAEMNRTIKEMKDALILAKEVRSETIEGLEKIQRQVEANKESIYHISKIMPAVAMTASEMRVSILLESQMLKRMIGQCKKGHASPDDYADLLRMEFMREVHHRNTHIESVGWRGEGIISIELLLTLLAKDTTIYRIETVGHWVNVTTDPKFNQYKGPKYAMYNHSSNCVKGINDPKEENIYEACTVQDYRDPKLEHWQVYDGTSISTEELLKPRVLKSPTEAIIYCLYSKITIDNVTIDCPHFPFRIPITIPFKVDGVQHEVEFESINATSKHFNYNLPNLGHTEVDQEFVKLINALKEKNRESLTPGKLAFDRQTLTIPVNIDSIISIISLIALLGTLFMALLKACKRSPDHVDQENEHIEINNYATVPASPPEQAVLLSAPPTAPKQLGGNYANLDLPYAYPTLHNFYRKHWTKSPPGPEERTNP